MFALQKAIAPASCLVLLNEHPLLKYFTSRSVAKHPVGESLTSVQTALGARGCVENNTLPPHWVGGQGGRVHAGISPPIVSLQVWKWALSLKGF